MASEHSHSEYDMKTRINAVTTLLLQAEREGLRISKEVQQVIERECMKFFNREESREDAAEFSAILKETAVRMFRQHRYREADRRYRMASLFNPKDATLVSNRATCMFNLGKFERCVDLCHICLTAFPTVLTDNTMLYFKVLQRLGRAHIELENFAEAQTTFRGLNSLRESLRRDFGVEIPDKDFKTLATPFERHLEQSMEKFRDSNPNTPISKKTNRRSRYILGEDGYLHEDTDVVRHADEAEDAHDDPDIDDDDDDDDDDEYDDVNTCGTVDLPHLCCHIYDKGTGPCAHQFPEEGDRLYRRRHEDDDDDGMDNGDDDDSDAEGMPELASSDPETDGESDDDSDNYSSENEDTSHVLAKFSKPADGNHRGGNPGTSDKRTRINSARSFRTRDSDSSDNEGRTSLSGNGASFTAAPKGTKEGQANLTNLRLAQDNSPRSSGMKRGFLRESSGKMASASEARPDKSPGESRPASAESPPLIPERPKMLYETDEEDGPMRGKLYDEKKVANAIDAYHTTAPFLPQDSSWEKSACIREVLGRSFPSSRVIDFTGIFGQHLAHVTQGKRKKRGCDRKCGACFARKMWRTRFISGDISEAERYLSALENDPRLDPTTFLSQDLWQGAGYYASGYEMSFDVPAFVHGVAYISLLQSELHWRGDSVPHTRDIQQAFIGALEKNFKCRQSLSFIYQVLFLLRDTINLFDVFPNRESRGPSRSFQFAKTANEVANAAWQTSETGNSSAAERSAHLMSRNDNCFQNLRNWGMLGHVAKEEEWVYKFLLRDVSNLVLSVTTHVTASPSAPRGETFSEAFQKACGDRDDDEKFWKYRIVSAMSKQRSRVIERNTNSRKFVDLERNATLLSRAIASRPNQPRLLYKRADVFSHLKKWGNCIQDLQRARLLLGEQLTVKQTAALLDPARHILLQHVYTLEGDAYSAHGLEPSRYQRERIKNAQECYVKALELNSRSKRTRTALQKKLRALEHREAECVSACTTSAAAPEVINNVASQSGGRSRRPDGSSLMGNDSVPQTRSTETQEQPGHVEDDHLSSADEDEQVAVAGNPYAALLHGGGASSSSHGLGAGPSAGLRCSLCSLKFSSKVDYDQHMKGRRHRSAVGKARKAGLLPEADGSYSAPSNRRGPTRVEVIAEAHRIAVSNGGEARLSEIANRMNFRRWKIRDAGSYVERTFGDLKSLCLEHSQLFELRAGASADPILKLARTEYVPVNRRTQPGAALTKQGVRLSSTLDFKEMVDDLLQTDGNVGSGPVKSDEEECGICLDAKPDVKVEPCGHVWCNNCLNQYLAKKGTENGVECPKCRGTITKTITLTTD